MRVAKRGGKYGVPHRTLRKRYAQVVAAGRAICARCGLPIDPLERWDLGHSDDGRSWTGPEHMRCNRSHGGKLRAEQLYGPRERKATRYEPQDPQARAVWREWWKQARLEGTSGPETWSRHWAAVGEYDGRCPDCRRLGVACENADGPEVA